ncbi:cell division protein FtsA [Thermincola ferriacetica]
MKETSIFALDIGTRSVIGVVMEQTMKGLEIIASESMEHKHQAMIDGQIHDIEQVALVVKAVKDKLEAKLGYELKQVAVAAAGRALKTVRAQVSQELEDFDEIKYDDVLRLELQGVQMAQTELIAGELQEENLVYNCVGYSVVNYALDGAKIRNLVGQKGREISADIIATFLPRVVVDSLFAVLQRAGLEMMSLTLEPIAASTVVVPPSMRQLNIALVDVGAGTSDIALTSDGSIIGYGMVPMAGDEITDAISHLYLVDFYQAEIIKRQVLEVAEVEFEDVLGNSCKVKSVEILEGIEETVNDLAKQICDKIISLNRKPPQAVICIGGGSLTPMLKEKIADYLNLTPQRVAVRGRDAIREVLGAQNLAGPEAVTPIGIAVTALENRGLGFAKVTVNGKEIRLFEVNKGTVGDALLAAGIDMKKLMPRLGLALTVTVNGKLEIIKGTRGKPAVIKLNGQEVSIDTPIRHNDVIEFIPAEDGQDATGKIKDILPNLMPLRIGINDRLFEVKPVITMNNELADMETDLIDNSRITYHMPCTVGEVLEQAGYTDDLSLYEITVNGESVDLLYELSYGDNLEVNKPVQAERALNPEDIPERQLGQIKGQYDGQPDSLAGQDVDLTAGDTGQEEINASKGNSAGQDGQELPLIQERLNFSVNEGDKPTVGMPPEQTIVYVNDKQILIPRNNLILTDIFTKIDFPFTPPGPGARLRMKVNGYAAEFTTPIKTGDRVELEWYS